MVFLLPTECIEEVILNLEVNKDLFSALMVNREWCKFAVPILWRNPFDSNNRENHCKKIIIRTYLSSLDQGSKLLLNSHGVDLSCITSSTAFNYASYMNHLSTTSLKFMIQQYMFPQTGFYSSLLNEDQNAFDQIKLVFTVICKLFISQSAEIKYIEFSDFWFDPLNAYSIPFATFEGADRSLANLQVFCCHGIPGKSNNAATFFTMSNVCKNIFNLEITLSTFEETKGLASLISAQNRLEHFKLISDIRFAVDFEDLVEFGDFNAISKSFPSLEYFFYITGESDVPSQSFCELVKTAQLNIKSIAFDVEVIGLISTVTKYCTKLEEISVISNDPVNMSFQDPWIFSPESLKIFLDSCKNTLKIFKIHYYNASFDIRDSEVNIKAMGKEHFEVIRQSGVKFLTDNDAWPRNTDFSAANEL